MEIVECQPSTLVNFISTMDFKSRLVALLTFSLGFNLFITYVQVFQVYQDDLVSTNNRSAIVRMFANNEKSELSLMPLPRPDDDDHSARLMRAIHNLASANKEIQSLNEQKLADEINRSSTPRPFTTTTLSTTTTTTTTTTTLLDLRWKEPFKKYSNIHTVNFRSLNILNKNSPVPVITYDLNNMLNFTWTNLPLVAHYMAPTGQHLENMTFLSQKEIVEASVSPIIAMAIDATNYDVAKATIRDIHRKILPRGFFDFIIYDLGLTRRQRTRLSMFCLCRVEKLDFARFPPHVKRIRTLTRSLIAWDVLFRKGGAGIWWFEPGSRITSGGRAGGGGRGGDNDRDEEDDMTAPASTAETADLNPWIHFLLRGLRLGNNFMDASRVKVKLGGGSAPRQLPFPVGVHTKCVTHPDTFVRLHKQYHTHFEKSPPVDLSMFVLFRTEVTMKGLLVPVVICSLLEDCVDPTRHLLRQQQQQKQKIPTSAPWYQLHIPPSCDSEIGRDGVAKRISNAKKSNDWCGCQSYGRSIFSVVLHRLFHWNKDVLADPNDYHQFYEVVPGDLSAKSYF